jgi:hypothetical protein
MLRTYDLLTVQQEPGGHWSVRLSQKVDSEESVQPDVAPSAEAGRLSEEMPTAGT